MRAPEEIEEPALPFPVRKEVRPGRAVHLYPLELPKDSELLLVSAGSVESIGCSLEARAQSGWTTLASATGRQAQFEVPLEKAQYRLRLWSLDERGGSVRLRADALAPTHVTESQLKSGASLRPLGGRAVAALAVDLERPGVFRLRDPGVRLRYSNGVGIPTDDAHEVLLATGTKLWVVADVAGGALSPTRRGWGPDAANAAPKVQASRLVLPAGDVLPLSLPGDRPVTVDLEHKTGGPVLAVVRSLADVPHEVIKEAGAPFQKTAVAMAIDPASARAAISAALKPGSPTAVVWTPTRSDVRLQQWSFEAPAMESGAWGRWGDALRGISARSFELPSGRKRIRVALGEASVAVLSMGDAVESVHWAGGETFEETIDGESTRLTLLHTRQEQDEFTVEILPLEGALGEVTATSPYERFQSTAGTLRIPIRSGDPPSSTAGTSAGFGEAGAATRTLHVRGAVHEGTFLGADGRVARGNDVPLAPGGGTLIIPHGTGWVLAWISSGEDAPGLWGSHDLGSATPVKTPARIPLRGPVTSLHVDTGGPAVLHFRSGAPHVTRLARAGAPTEVDVHPSGSVLDVFLPEGTAEITLRALGGATLSGSAELTASLVTPIGEGLGPEVVLPSGSTHFFSFTVNREGRVGIGVRADSDVVNALLQDGRGKKLGAGVVQMPLLAQGTYLLALTVPPDRAPVRARPALAGVTPPDTGPPADVIRRYLEMESKGKPEDQR